MMNKTTAMIILLTLMITSTLHAQPFWLNTAQKDANEPPLNNNARLITGNFTGGQNDELLSITHGKQPSWEILTMVRTQYFQGGDIYSWENLDFWHSSPYISSGQGTMDQGSINPWVIDFGDQYIVGNFYGQMDDDELLAINPNGNYHTLQWDASGWGGWATIARASNGLIQTDDQYFPGDFDGDGYDELLAIYANGWVRLMKFDGISWNIINDNNGSGSIKWWWLNSNDHYIVGDFLNVGSTQLMAANVNGWHHIMNFDTQTMSWDYVDGGSNGQLASTWNIATTDDYIVGDYNCDGSDDILAYSANNTSQTMSFDNGWYTFTDSADINGEISAWPAAGITGWNINTTDIRLSGSFAFIDNQPCKSIVNISSQDWLIMKNFTNNQQ